MFFFYADDRIFLCPEKKEGAKVLNDLKATGLELEDRGTISDYFGTIFNFEKNGSITISVNESSASNSQLETQCTPTSYPSSVIKVTTKGKGDLPDDGGFYYRSVIGQLNYLEKCTRPDITYVVHQCVIFLKILGFPIPG